MIVKTGNAAWPLACCRGHGHRAKLLSMRLIGGSDNGRTGYVVTCHNHPDCSWSSLHYEPVKAVAEWNRNMMENTGL